MSQRALDITEEPEPEPATAETDIHVRSQFGKHVPRILRRQLILQLMQQYLEDEKAISKENTDHTAANECKPSLQRFHGSLLFVDISGFTALSLQLTPEDLQHHINEYFSKMLSIVDKHGGDVIKFAGDALFIVWETSQMVKTTGADGHEEKMDFASASKAAISTAVECGLEICHSCSNHRVSLLPRNQNTAAEKVTPVSGILKDGQSVHISGHQGNGSHSVSPTTGTTSPADVAFLNVHCGVTMGLMAGIDIGCQDRWEFFLMGEPLTKVAIAESQASTGDIVICPESHAVLHPVVRPIFRKNITKTRLKLHDSFFVAPSPLPSPSNSIQNELFNFDLSLNLAKVEGGSNNAADPLVSTSTLPCGCVKGANGYVKVKRSNLQSFSGGGHHTARNKIKTKINDVHVFDETNGEIESVFDNFMASRLHELSSLEDIQNEFCREISNTVTTNKVIMGAFKMKHASTAVISMNKFTERVKLGFIKWAHSCLIDDIARHVHDVVRTTYRFEDTSRVDVCRREISKQLESIHNFEKELNAKEMFREKMMQARKKKQAEQSVKIMEGTSSFLKRTMSTTTGNRLQKRPSANHMMHQGEQAGYSAEIRSVTVMFVKIDMPHMDLTIEQQNFGEHIGQFGFLSKTVNEGLADVLLLHRLQSCIEGLSEAFHTHGGQLRQFIVDDKGTVCIGTFGLRGAVSDDNAAAALETAHLIVIKLQGLGLNCSIGVTVGKAFCGLVGSHDRHEYAVMGPSTNLSARLMCKAPPGGIICDVEIRNFDRTHQFVALADIVAKGYKNPVGTYKPVFDSGDGDLALTKSRLMSMLSYHNVRHNSTMRSGTHTISSENSTRFDRQDSLSSNEDEDLEEGRTWVVTKMCRGPFWASVPYDQKSSDGKTRRELIGRDSEVKQVLAFLFKTVVDEIDEVTQFMTNQASRFAGLIGPQGIGKSSVISAIVTQVTSVTVSEPTLKIHVFKSRTNGFQAAVPFNSFKPIFTEMFIRIYNISKTLGVKNRRRSAIIGNADSTQEVLNGVHFVMTQVPESLRKYEPLLGFLTFIPENPEAIAALKMSTQDMVLTATELLFEIIQLYVRVTHNLVFLVIEDVHSFDLASLTLLRQLWTSGQGVLVLFTTEHVYTHKRNSGAAKTTPSLSVAAATLAIDLDLPAPNDFVASLDDSERYVNVELELFSLSQTAAVVKAALANSGVVGTDKEILEMVFEESGGNPMYAYELAKQIAAQQSEVIDRSAIQVNMTHCHRLEEIICHRFDQLSTSAQSLLKIAAAICCFGSSFTFKMLVYVMDAEMESASLKAESKMVIDLLDIVSSESFLRAVDQLSVDDDRADVTAEGIANGQYTFEFTIALEKSTIYELLLSDQKHEIHERIGEYFMIMRREFPNGEKHFAEESLHWQRASNWQYAMACSYHASLVESNERKAKEHVDTAYRMYSAMREQQKGSQVNFGGEIGAEWGAEQMKKLYEHSMMNSEELKSDSDFCTLSLDEVSQMFNCDAELLKISLHVVILMARRCLSRVDRLIESQVNLEEAMQILLLTKNKFLLSSKRVTQLMQFLEQYKGSSASPVHKDDEHYFTVGRDFEPICMKLLSAYIETYLQLLREPELSASFPKVQFVMKRFHDWVKRRGGFHDLQLVCLEVRFHCKVGNLKHASSLAQKMIEIYDHGTHSALLIDYYGRDAVPTAVAAISQYLFLSSEWRTPLKLLQCALSTIERMTSVESISAAVYYVTNSLVFLRRFDDALKLFEYYLSCAQLVHEERSLAEVCYLEWLRRLVKFEAFMASGDADLFLDDSEAMDTMIAQGCGALSTDSTPRANGTFDTLAVQGRGFDAVLAEVCALKIILLWGNEERQEELKVYVKALGVFARSTLSMVSGRPHELVFSKTSIVLLMLFLIQSLAGAAPPKAASPKKSDSKDEAKEDYAVGEGSGAGTGTAAEGGESGRRSPVMGAHFDVIRSSLSKKLLAQLRGDCHYQYSVFTLLALSLLYRVVAEYKAVEDANAGGQLGRIVEAEETDDAAEGDESPASTGDGEDSNDDDFVKGGSEVLQQFLVLESTELKRKVCDWSRMSEVASEVLSLAQSPTKDQDSNREM